MATASRCFSPGATAGRSSWHRTPTRHGRYVFRLGAVFSPPFCMLFNISLGIAICLPMAMPGLAEHGDVDVDGDGYHHGRGS